MSLLRVFLFLAVVASATFAYPSVDDQTTVEVLTIDDISKLKDLPQGAELIPLIQPRSNGGPVRYTLGERSSNDRLVSQAYASKSWDEPQNVQLRSEYPANGVGAVITYVEIEVNQSYNNGRAYVVSGGIGERRIVIVVESNRTNWFSFVLNIYGV